MKRILTWSFGLALLVAAPVFGQKKATVENVPEMPYTVGAELFETSSGRISRRIGRAWPPTPRDMSSSITAAPPPGCFEFDQAGNFIKEIGSGYYGFEFAHSVRVDKDDNIWTVDEGTNMVTKFSPDGRVLMVLGRRPPAVAGVLPFPAGPNEPAQKYIFCRPTDVGWDPQGNIFVSDGYCNNRVVKYDKNGRFMAQVGSEKRRHGDGRIQSAARHCRWTAKAMSGSPDRGNNRYQVLDNDLKPIREITNLGTAWTACISSGPHQYAFLSNSNPNGNMPGTWEITGEIYKAELDGTVIGKFGHPGKLPPGFQVVHNHGLPQSERAHLGRDRILARAEIRIQANRSQVRRRRGEIESRQKENTYEKLNAISAALRL